MRKLWKAYRKWSMLTKLTNTMIVEKENVQKHIITKEWDKVNYWLTRSKKTIRACRKILYK